MSDGDSFLSQATVINALSGSDSFAGIYEQLDAESSGRAVASRSAAITELPQLSRSWCFAKRVIDLIGSAVLILVLLPALAVIYLLIRRSGGPAIYGHARLGRGATWFTCYKFRTMVPNADAILAELLKNDAEARAEWRRDEKLRDDPRITTVGAFLRRTSLDELPQLFNVFVGHMSLVGPRPATEEGLAHYGKGLRWYFAVRPGMTGLWQVSGRNLLGFRRRVVLDMHYVRAQSLVLDFQILIRTVHVVLFGDGY